MPLYVYTHDVRAETKKFLDVKLKSFTSKSVYVGFPIPFVSVSVSDDAGTHNEKVNIAQGGSFST